ncbi:MAG: arsenite methyltransferase [Verrucomicrobia bacterium]|nr:arsenite methyltransferase [Verrucomicrobiota bacterium]
MNAQELEHDGVRTVVRERYVRIAEDGGNCGCAPACCTPRETPAADPAEPAPHPDAAAQRLGYSPAETRAAPQGANLGLGCGNPQALASLQPGESVLDLGSGAGFDAFLAARAVGPTGRVVGVDMTPEMVSRARGLQAQGDYDYGHVEFRLGEIEHLPVADASVDVILSNCVINLSPDKPQVFREAFRVLRSGGRLAVADIVALAPIPEALLKDWALYTGCVAGASTPDTLETMLRTAGFADIRITPQANGRGIVRDWMPGHDAGNYIASARIEARKP